MRPPTSSLMMKLNSLVINEKMFLEQRASSMRYAKDELYAPGTRVGLVNDRKPESLSTGVVLYVGSDAHVLVGWDDESVAVLPQEALLAISSVSD